MEPFMTTILWVFLYLYFLKKKERKKEKDVPSLQHSEVLWYALGTIRKHWCAFSSRCHLYNWQEGNVTKPILSHLPHLAEHSKNPSLPPALSCMRKYTLNTSAIFVKKRLSVNISRWRLWLQVVWRVTLLDGSQICDAMLVTWRTTLTPFSLVYRYERFPDISTTRSFSWYVSICVCVRTETKLWPQRLCR